MCPTSRVLENWIHRLGDPVRTGQSLILFRFNECRGLNEEKQSGQARRTVPLSAVLSLRMQRL